MLPVMAWGSYTQQQTNPWQNQKLKVAARGRTPHPDNQQYGVQTTSTETLGGKLGVLPMHTYYREADQYTPTGGIQSI